MTPYYQKDGITLYHGDCLEILPTFESDSIDMIFTDPPYGHNNNNGDLIHRREEALGKGKGKRGESRPIPNDGPEANMIFRKSLAEYARIIKPGCCCCCCCGGGGPDPQFARWSLWIDEVLDFKQMVVWDKGPIGMGWHYRRSYETVLVANKPGKACKWFDTSKRVENIIRPNSGIRKIIPSATQHPTQKPESLGEHFISLHTETEDIVLDPFAGSGTTGVACIRKSRRFVGIELEEKYCEMAAKRFEAEFQKTNLYAEVAK